MSLIFLNCKTNELEPELDTNQIEVFESDAERNGRRSSIEFTDSEIELGKKLINPYSIVNMKEAQSKLAENYQETTNIAISTNYLYLKLTPTSQKSAIALNNEEGVDLFNYPLDYEVVKQGNIFKKKELTYPSFYCAAPIEKTFPQGVIVEVVEELFLPFGNGQKDSYSLNVDAYDQETKTYLSNLEEKSLMLTGNTQEEEGLSNAKVMSWQASGKIGVWDDFYPHPTSPSYVGVPEVTVRANRWFTTKTAKTTSDGSFYIPHTWSGNNKVNYSVKWENDQFNITDGLYTQAYFNGPKQYGAWYLYIQKPGTPKSFAYAHVQRGGNEYYQNASNYGIQSPPTKQYFAALPGFGSKMSLAVINSNLGSPHYFHLYNNFGASEIALPFDVPNISSVEMFATTVHELAHASHWSLGFTNSNYIQSKNNRKLAESWAQAVGWYITRAVYSVPPFFTLPQNETDSRQGMTLTTIEGSNYTPLFIDLIDNFNQFAVLGGTVPEDLASGYSLGQLEDYLIPQATNSNQLYEFYRDYLRDNSANPTEAQALILFDMYDKP